jgi:DNA polymerase I-like protein with 3'-5' exonuclease and polymerase domains
VSLPDFVAHPDPSVYRLGIPLFLDFETTTHEKGLAIYKENSIVLACWQFGWDGQMETEWGSEFDLVDLVRDVEMCDFIVAHNSKFELQWLARCGVDLSEVLVYDTMLAEYVIGGNRWQTGQLSLESCLQRRKLGGKVSLVSKMIKAGVDTRDIPSSWLEKYCQRDVSALTELMRAQLTDMEGTRLLPVVYSRCLLTPVLADLESEGLKLDPDVIRMTLDELSTKADELVIELNRMTGGINLASPIQLAEFLYDKLGFEEHRVKKGGKWGPKRTATNRRMTGADEISSLKVTTKDQQRFMDLYLEHRDVHNQLTKYMRKFKDCCDEADGVLLAQFNQMQSRTHRLSSSGLRYKTQFQNLPRSYKRMFKAKRDGWLMGEVDGAQLEFRVAAHLGRDDQAIEDIRAKVDVHAFTSKTLTDAGQPTDRQGAKEHTFKPLYGGSSGTDAEQTYYRAFKDRYKGVAAVQGTWINTVLMEKKLETEWGLVYYWPDTKMDRSGYITNTTSICNYPVQAFATAEIIPLALVCMWHRLKMVERPGIALVNTIHDSIIAEVHPEKVEEFHTLARQALIDDARMMIDRLYGIDLVCPLGCGVKVGDRWGQGEEHKYERMEEAA